MAGINFYKVTNPDTSAGTLDYLENSLRSGETATVGVERDLPEDVTELRPEPNQTLEFDVNSGYMTDEITTFIGHTLTGNTVQLHASNAEPESPALLSVVVEEPDESPDDQ